MYGYPRASNSKASILKARASNGPPRLNSHSNVTSSSETDPSKQTISPIAEAAPTTNNVTKDAAVRVGQEVGKPMDADELEDNIIKRHLSNVSVGESASMIRESSMQGKPTAPLAATTTTTRAAVPSFRQTTSDAMVIPERLKGSQYSENQQQAKMSLLKTLAARKETLTLRNKAIDNVPTPTISIRTNVGQNQECCSTSDNKTFDAKLLSASTLESSSTTSTAPLVTAVGNVATTTSTSTQRRRVDEDSPMRKIQTLLSSAPLTPALYRASISASSSTTNNLEPKTAIGRTLQQDSTIIERKHENNLHPKRNEKKSSITFVSSADFSFSMTTPKAGTASTSNMQGWGELSPPPVNTSLPLEPDVEDHCTESSSFPEDRMLTEIDATCIPYNSHVQIQIGALHKANTIACHVVTGPIATTTTAAIESTAENNGGSSTRNKRTTLKYEASAREPSNVVSTHGIHNSSLVVVYVKTILSSAHDSAPTNPAVVQTSTYEKVNSARIVRYGDIIALHSPLARNRALGVRQVEMNQGGTTGSSKKVQELGFYRSVLGDKEKWLVLSSLQTIRIGTNVRDLESILYNETALCCMDHPVRSNGNPITLLNIATGGILSLRQVDKDGSSSLTMVTNGDGLHNVFSSGTDDCWILKQVGAPSCPRWNGQRLFLLERYLLHSDRHVVAERSSAYPNLSSDDECIGDLSVHVQEKLFLKELLGAMMGMEGRHIKFSFQPQKLCLPLGNFLDYEFMLSMPAQKTIDPSLMHLVQQMLPLCTDYACVNEFVGTRQSTFEYGLVAQALASAVTTLIQEYLAFVCQMEQLLYQSNSLTISKLWSFVQPSISVLRTLRRITGTARYHKGGHLLTQVQNLVSYELDGDERARDIATRVMEEACKPYMDMLSSWISKGKVYDPFHEFMVENKYPFELRRSTIHPSRKGALTSLNSSVWEDCFCLCRQHIYLINDDAAEKVLTTGKYLNVIRECSAIDASKPEYRTLTIDSVRGCIVLTEQIYDAYDSSAATVLNLILTDYQFVDSLRFVKKFFLIEQGDFFVQFLDMAEKELLSPVTKVSRTRIQTLLLMSIQLSGNNSQKTAFLDELVCEFARDHLIDRLDAIHKTSGGIMGGPQLQTPSGSYKFPISHHGELKGIETFTLDCKINWPLSLILSRQAMELYKLLFRHLFFCKYVERRLFATWLDHQMLKEFELRALLGKTYCLRQRMLHLMQNLVYYMMFEVIEPHWHKLMAGIANVKTVDDLARIHNFFQASVSQECLLTNIALLRILAKLMTTCLSFADHIRLFMRKAGIEEELASAATEYRLNRWSTHTRKLKATNRARTDQEKRSTRLALQTMRLEHELKSVAYQKMIDVLQIDFDLSLSMFMDQLMNDSSAQSHSHLANLATRLDFNYFISSGRQLS